MKNKHHKIALFMDNLQVHKTSFIKLKLQELGIEPIYNTPYTPDQNCCEALFSIAKNYYKRQKLHRLVNEEEVNFRDLVEDSVKQLTK